MVALFSQRKSIYYMWLKQHNGILVSGCLLTSTSLNTLLHFQIHIFCIVSLACGWLAALYLNIYPEIGISLLSRKPFCFWNVLNVFKFLTLLRKEIFLSGTCTHGPCPEDYQIPGSSLRLSKSDSLVMSVHSLYLQRVPFLIRQVWELVLVKQ